MQPLYAFKSGDVARGNWSWAVCADSRVHGKARPYVLATTNFHGCIAAGHDPEKLALMMAAAPAMLAALQFVARAPEAMAALCRLGFAEAGRDYSQDVTAAIAAATGER